MGKRNKKNRIKKQTIHKYRLKNIYISWKVH